MYIPKQFLLCHLAKMNNHWKIIEKVNDLKVIFKGPDCYISPSWFSDPNNVPTWNYVSIQVSGEAFLMNDDELMFLLNKLSEKHESRFEQPWTIQKMDEKKLNAMKNAIVGIKISIDSISAKAKLSQNKSDESFSELALGLSDVEDANTKKVLELMKTSRGYNN